jgi:hypothetical protein
MEEVKEREPMGKMRTVNDTAEKEDKRWQWSGVLTLIEGTKTVRSEMFGGEVISWSLRLKKRVPEEQGGQKSNGLESEG